MKGNFIIIDCETGGVDCTKNPITEFAALAVDCKTLKEIDKFSTFVKPYADLEITQTALERTMVTTKDIKNGVEYNVLCDMFIDFCKSVNDRKGAVNMPVWVGHNAAFDVAFVDYMFKHAGKKLSKAVSTNNGIVNTYDTLQQARLIWGMSLRSDENQSFTLTACCSRAGIKLVDAHGAMNDCHATHKLLQFFSNVEFGTNNPEKGNKKTKQRDFFQI